MPFIPVPGAAQFNVRGTVNTIPMENVLHFIKEDEASWDQTDLSAAISVLLPSWDTNMLGVLSGGYEALTVYARDLTLASGAVAEGSFASGSTGVVSGDPLPGSVAACITHRTGQAGRSYRGRTFIGGISENSTLGNQLADVYAAALIAAWQQVIDDMSAAGYSFVIVSKFTANAPRLIGIWTVVQSSVLRDQRVDSQRRRLT